MPAADLSQITFERITEGHKEDISVLDYFHLVYSLELKHKVQPCFLCKFAGKIMHIPSEACSFEGIPMEIKKNKMAMKQVFQNCMMTPKERIQKSVDGMRKIIATQELSKWGLEIDDTPTEVEAKILIQPRFSKTKNYCTEESLRRLEVENSANFKGYNWTMAYNS